MDAATFTPTAPNALAEPLKMNRRQAAKALTRTRIMRSAAALFAATDGYVGATIRDIAQGANMSTGAFFASFASKRDAYIAIKGHAPVTTEQGRELFLITRRLLVALQGSPLGDAVDLAALEKAVAVIEATVPPGIDPEVELQFEPDE